MIKKKMKIKFRAKSLTRGDFVYGSLIKIDEEGDRCFIVPFYNSASSLSCKEIICMSLIPVDENTIGEFTGLKDINGVEIYEGDTVHQKPTLLGDDEEITGEVDFDEGAWWIEDKKTGKALRLWSETRINLVVRNSTLDIFRREIVAEGTGKVVKVDRRK